MSTVETRHLNIKHVILEDAVKTPSNDPREPITSSQIAEWVDYLNKGYFQASSRIHCAKDLVIIFPHTRGWLNVGKNELDNLGGIQQPNSWVTYVYTKSMEQVLSLDRKGLKRLTGGLKRELRSRFFAQQGENDFVDFASARLVYPSLDLSEIEADAVEEANNTLIQFRLVNSDYVTEIARATITNFKLAFPQRFADVDLPDDFFERLENYGKNVASLDKGAKYISHLKDMCVLKAEEIKYDRGRFQFVFDQTHTAAELIIPEQRRF